MTIRSIALAAGLTVAALAAGAQPVDPMDSAQPRSRASTMKPLPRLMSPSEASNSIAASGFFQPDRQVVPQVAVPLGQGESTRPELAPYMRRGSPNGDNPAASFEEASASCEARAGEGMRAVCRDRLARAHETGTAP